MDDLAADLFARHPTLELAALGSRENRGALDLAPFGRPVRYLAAEEHPTLVERYRSANQYALPGELALPGWSALRISISSPARRSACCFARRAPFALRFRKRLALRLDDEAIAAAYLAAPTVTPGLFIGVSLISLVPDIVAGAWVKALTLRMLRAKRMRGVAQWANPAVRVHTRMGPLRVVGAVPGTHAFRSRSFVYECLLDDDGRWHAAMARKLSVTPSHRVLATDTDTLRTILDRAEAGERITIVPPGLDASGHVLFGEGF